MPWAKELDKTQTCLLIGVSLVIYRPMEQGEPYDGRLSRTVRRAAGGEVPPADSTRPCSNSTCPHWIYSQCHPGNFRSLVRRTQAQAHRKICEIDLPI